LSLTVFRRQGSCQVNRHPPNTPLDLNVQARSCTQADEEFEIPAASHYECCLFCSSILIPALFSSLFERSRREFDHQAIPRSSQTGLANCAHLQLLSQPEQERLSGGPAA
jgi:hypothetical protein